MGSISGVSGGGGVPPVPPSSDNPFAELNNDISNFLDHPSNANLATLNAEIQRLQNTPLSAADKAILGNIQAEAQQYQKDSEIIAGFKAVQSLLVPGSPVWEQLQNNIDQFQEKKDLIQTEINKAAGELT